MPALIHQDDVYELRVMYATGDYTVRVLALRFGYDPGTVHRIVTGASYPSVPGPTSAAGKNRRGWDHIPYEQKCANCKRAAKVRKLTLKRGAKGLMQPRRAVGVAV